MNDSLSIDVVKVNFNIYKKVFVMVLSKITYGYITITDSYESLSFGDEAHELKANLIVKSDSFYKDIFWAGGIGLAESFINNDWETDNLTYILRIFTLNLDLLNQFDNSIRGISIRAISKALHFINKNSINGAKKNIYRHYDLGNNFFELFLDQSMMYSSAIYNDYSDSLSNAAINKLKITCDRLQLKSSDHLLEIGSGWGALAIYAAQNYGCKVTTTTISEEQYEYAKTRIIEEKLDDKITILKQDYRTLTGQYDKLVSIEMIEAVGHQYYSNYFEQCSKLIKPNGLFLLQAITIADQRYKSARDSVDFIKKHIFPGCCIPSISEIMLNIRNQTNYSLLDVHDITLDYAHTLRAWRLNFMENLSKIRALGFDEQFIRKWDYYFCYCEAGFAERAIFDYQLLFSKPMYRTNDYKLY